MRTFLLFASVASVASVGLGLTGCYDLSTPTGPHPDDFARNDDPTEQQAQEPTPQTATEHQAISPVVGDALGHVTAEHREDDVKSRIAITHDDGK